MMKVKLTVSAASNCTYKREKIVNLGLANWEWDEMSQEEQWEFLDDMSKEFVWDDISCTAEVSE